MWRQWRHNENDVTVTTAAGLWRYGDWRHAATGGTAVWRGKTLSYNALSSDGPSGRAVARQSIVWLDGRPLCSGLLARSERRRQCTFTRAPLRPPTSHWLSFNKPVRNSLITASYRLCATPSVSLVQLQNRLGLLSKPSFLFWFGFPQNRGFGFKTDRGLISGTSG